MASAEYKPAAQIAEIAAPHNISPAVINSCIQPGAAASGSVTALLISTIDGDLHLDAVVIWGEPWAAITTVITWRKQSEKGHSKNELKKVTEEKQLVIGPRGGVK